MADQHQNLLSALLEQYGARPEPRHPTLDQKGLPDIDWAARRNAVFAAQPPLDRWLDEHDRNMRAFLSRGLPLALMALPGRSVKGAGVMPDHIMAAQLERRLPTMDGYYFDGTRSPSGGLAHRTQIPIDPGITGGTVSRAEPGAYNWMDFGTFSRYPEVQSSAYGLAKNEGIVSARNPAPPYSGMDWPPANASVLMRYHKMLMDQARTAKLRQDLDVIPGGRTD